MFSCEMEFVNVPAIARDEVSQELIEVVVLQGRLQASMARVAKAVCECRMGLIACSEG